MDICQDCGMFKIPQQNGGDECKCGTGSLNNKDVYVSQLAMSNCKWCGRDQDLRMGVCFDCAEAQTIMVSGKDMYEKGEGGIEFPVKECTERIRMLIKKGWIPPKD